MATAKVLRATIVFLSVAVVTLAQLNLPNRAFWDDLKILLYVGVGVLAVASASQIFESARQVLQTAKLRAYERDMRATLGAALKQIVKEFGLEWDVVGVHAFLVRRILGRKHLVNVGGLRLGARPSMAAPRWRPKKGVVGLAFHDQIIYAEDWHDFFTSAASGGLSQWNQRPSDQRYGLTWGELNLTADYKAIVACPIFKSNGKLYGCVSITAPLTEWQCLSVAVRSTLRDLATGVYLLGPPPQAWWSFDE